MHNKILQRVRESDQGFHSPEDLVQTMNLSPSQAFVTLSFNSEESKPGGLAFASFLSVAFTPLAILKRT